VLNKGGMISPKKLPEIIFNKKNHPLLIIVGVFFFVSLALLKLSDIFQVSEAREGSVVKAILKDHNWILPLRSSFALPSKPLLFHWIGATFANIAGSYDEFLLRFPSLLAGLGTLLSVSIYARRIGGNNAGLFAPAILSTMYGFSRMSSDGRVDMLFCFFLTTATLYGLKGVNEKITSRERYIIGILMGLATLSKGPIGIIVPLVVILASRLSLKGFSAWKEVIGFELLLSFVIAAPWYYLAYLQVGDIFVDRQLIFENVERFFGGEGIAEKSSWFYFIHIFGQGAPWSILFFIYLFFLGRDSYIKGQGINRNNRFLPGDKKVSQAIINCLLWFGVLLLALTLSAGKRRAYLLLCLPSIALILAFRFSTALEQFGGTHALVGLIRKHRYHLLTWGILIIMIGLVPGITLFGVGTPDSLIKIWPIVGAAVSTLKAVSIRGGWTLIILFSFLSASTIGLWIWGMTKQNPKLLGYSIVLFLNLTITLYTQTGLSFKSVTHSYKRIGYRLATVIKPDKTLTIVKKPSDESFDVLLFYYGRGVDLFDPGRLPKKPGLYLVRKNWLDANPNPHFTVVFTETRPSDDEGEEVVLMYVS
jgi:4-amino-4-deoxy-L-arabinose transferase-like glycosyltransferase